MFTLSQLHAMIEADRGAQLQWHVPVPHPGLGVLLATWAPLVMVLGCVVIAVVQR